MTEPKIDGEKSNCKRTTNEINFRFEPFIRIHFEIAYMQNAYILTHDENCVRVSTNLLAIIPSGCAPVCVRWICQTSAHSHTRIFAKYSYTYSTTNTPKPENEKKKEKKKNIADV